MSTDNAQVRDRFVDVGTCASTGCAVRLCYHVFDPHDGAQQPSPQHHKHNSNDNNSNDNNSRGGGNDTSTSALPCVLLLAGIASPAAMWDDALCRALAAAVPCRVLRYDQRDTGLSTHITRRHVTTTTASRRDKQDNNKSSDDDNDKKKSDKTAATCGSDEGADDLLALVQSSPPDASSSNSSSSSDSSSSGAESFGARTYLRYAAALLRPGHYVVPALYTLDDMARDVIGLLRALDIRAVHLVGISLGGMVAQCVTLQQPHHVRSLTLLATHTSEAGVVQWPSMRDLVSFARYLPRRRTATTTAPPSVAAAVDSSHDVRHTTGIRARPATSPPPSSQADTDHNDDGRGAMSDAEVRARASDAVRFVERVWGDGVRYPFPRALMRQRAEAVLQRCPHVEGAVRHFAALINAPGRDAALQRCITSIAPAALSGQQQQPLRENACDGRVYVPTVIVQGTHDILCPPRNAAHLARVIAGSRVHMLQGMGHVLVPQLFATYVQLIVQNVQTGEAYARAQQQQQHHVGKSDGNKATPAAQHARSRL